jgi:hypothetical protein
MKLSEQTLKILKNFASINPSILFHPGNLLTTKSISGVIVAEAQIEEEFPLEFALYDLVEFLNTLKLFKSPLLDFGEAENNYMYICEEDNLDFRVRYTFTSKECIKYPERRPVMGNVDISFKMDTGTLDSIMKASTVMQLPNMVIVPGKEGYIDLSVSDAKDRSSNKFSVTMKGDGPVDRDYKLIFKMENFKMLSYDYDVSICGKDVSSFESDVIDYYIALELTSRW